jgi:hypothetical protein
LGQYENKKVAIMAQRDIVEAWLANKDLEDLESYLKRGRQLANVPLKDLRERWLAMMRAWAASGQYARRALN